MVECLVFNLKKYTVFGWHESKQPRTNTSYKTSVTYPDMLGTYPETGIPGKTTGSYPFGSRHGRVFLSGKHNDYPPPPMPVVCALMNTYAINKISTVGERTMFLLIGLT